MIHKLEADSILLTLDTRTILSDIYLKCETGKITGLLGRNGNGKSCLMNIIYGSLNATSKSIRIDDKYLLNGYQRPDLLSYLPQFNFIPKQLSLKRVFSDFQLDYAGFESLFPEFNSKYNSKIKELSGGQRRLTELYMALTGPSEFALLDEPFSHLSPVTIEIVMDFIRSCKQNKGIIITDHLFRSIIEISDNIYLLTDGKSRLIKNLEEIEFYGYAKM